jgi:hypothetical protein
MLLALVESVTDHKQEQAAYRRRRANNSPAMNLVERNDIAVLNTIDRVQMLKDAPGICLTTDTAPTC